MSSEKQKESLTKQIPIEMEELNSSVLRKTDQSVGKTQYLESLVERGTGDLRESERKSLFSEIKYSQLHLDANKERNLPMSKTRKKLLDYKTKKKLKLFEVPKDLHKYVLYEPLNDLWLSYIHDVIDFSQDISGKYAAQTEQALMKVDYHGCKMKVTKAKVPSLLEHEGIMIQETKNTWRIITEQDEMKVIPKYNTVMSFVVDGFKFSIQGTNFMFKTSERSSRKYKKFKAYPL